MISLEDILENTHSTFSTITSTSSTPTNTNTNTSDMSQLRIDTVLPVNDVQAPVALDPYTEEDMIFWTDIKAKTISRAHLNGSKHVTVIRSGLGEASSGFLYYYLVLLIVSFYFSHLILIVIVTTFLLTNWLTNWHSLAL